VRLRDARADLPTGFVRVVERAIAADPQERYATAGAFEADLVGALRDTAPEPVAIDLLTRHSWTWVPRAGILLAALAAVVAIAAVLWPASRAWRTPVAVAPAAIRSIAVLPLANLSGDQSQEYFADGMTDELIATLGQLGGINVISRTSIMQFKGSTKPLPEIAKALHVDAVLESSFMLVPGPSTEGRDGAKRVRINARLIYAGTDTQLWDRTFESIVSDVLALQSQVAQAVADGIDLHLTAKQQGSLARNNRENMEAQDAYLQGRYLLQISPSRTNLLKARAYLERAVQIDPSYGRAYASLARCYTLLDINGVLPRQEAARLVAEALRAAIRIDDTRPEAQNELARFSHLYSWDWATAERAYRRAIDLNPSYSFARSEYARFLMADARLDEAMSQAKLAVEGDPLSAEASGVVALVLYYQRKYDEAIAQRVKAIELNPSSAPQYLMLGRTYAAQGAFDRAVVELQRALTLSGGAPYIEAELARTDAAAGRRREAQVRIASLLAARNTNGAHLAAQYPAYVYAALGDPDRAFEWLDRAIAEREPNVLWAKVDPRFDDLRQDPRFGAFLARITRGR
jgi:TolB-like protein/cytochrome c-type biogenesis protein CcmH/NrfG